MKAWLPILRCRGGGMGGLSADAAERKCGEIFHQKENSHEEMVTLLGYLYSQPFFLLMKVKKSI
jgi:hypothetical protein